MEKTSPKIAKQILPAFYEVFEGEKRVGIIKLLPNACQWGFYHIGASRVRFYREIRESLFEELNIKLETETPKQNLLCKGCGGKFVEFRHDSVRRPICKDCLEKKDDFWKKYVYGIEEMIGIREKYYSALGVLLEHFPEYGETSGELASALEEIFNKIKK